MLAAPVPLTLVPEDAVPEGTPRALEGPVVASVAAAVDYPRWWDLAAAAALVAPDAGEWETGRLRPDGDGPVRVYRTLSLTALEAAYDEGFAR